MLKSNTLLIKGSEKEKDSKEIFKELIIKDSWN